MRSIITVGVLLLCGVDAVGQQPVVHPVSRPDPALVRLRARVNPEFPSWSPAQVLTRCAEHLATVSEYDRPRIRYFDMTDAPGGYLPSVTGATLFGCNSAARSPMTAQPRAVPNTDQRIFWIDLAWYNWTPEAWEAISGEDPYFREPIIPSNSVALVYLKAQTRANAVVRAGWWLWYTFDSSEFLDAGQLRNENSFYDKLVYSDVEFVRDGKKVRGVGPKTAAEFEQAWFVDFTRLKDFPTDRGAMVDTGFSRVAYNNRILWRVRGSAGTYWRTFDVQRTAGDQDFVETPFPKKFDAGEHIFQDERGAQFYLLSDGNGAALDFANPFIVKGDPASSPHNDVLVTSRSCIHCHDSGILSFRNEHPRLRDAGVELKALGLSRAQRFEQFFLQDAKLQRLVRQDQDNYAEFVRDCNGLTTQENLQGFIRARSWYGQPVGLQQAARELGCVPQELADALGHLATKGRLGQLALTGQPIPRATWERGGYAEAGLLLLEWRKAGKTPQ